MAYPYQAERYRPSGIGSCALKQAAGVNGVPMTDEIWSTIWQAELGRAGQDIALKAFPALGFDIVESIKVEGALPGEIDVIADPKEWNVLRLPSGEGKDNRIVGDVKCRNTYAYVHIWKGEDLLAENKDVAIQMNTYMGQAGIDKGMIILLPFDSAGCRNELKYNAKRVPNPDISPYIRVFTIDFDPGLFALTVRRKAELEMYGLEVAREYDPTRNAFPCTYCSWMQWCRGRDNGGVVITALPDSGMPMVEHVIP